MARSFPWRCVSMPRGARASSNVPAMVQRRTHQVRICAGVCARLVDKKAVGLRAFWDLASGPNAWGQGGAPGATTRRYPYGGHAVFLSVTMASSVARHL